MRYFDAKRPLYENDPTMPQLVTPSGRPFVMPVLYIEPLAEGTWEVRVHVPTGVGRFRQLAYKTSDLAEFGAAWMEDPEEVLRRRFGYDFSMDDSKYKVRGAAGAARSATSLEDLGLE